MSLGATIGLLASLGLDCFGAGWLTVHAIKTRGTRAKDWR
jgi:hypothetical protein